MRNSKVLLVEDESDVRELMLLHLKREGCDVQAVEDGEAALRELALDGAGAPRFGLVILDWMLPGLSGLEICKKIRAQADWAPVPVLMVTARADTADIVLGLELGADDYITKPFEIPVFVARARALLRRAASLRSGALPDPARAATAAGDQDLRIKGLILDPRSHRVTCEGSEVTLTPSEFKLLHSLMLNQGRVLSRERLIDLVQGHGVTVVDRAIDTHVFGLRKKLGPCAEIIETVRGVGYRVDQD